eukprot:TRINITY_DN10655_c0_g1_i5.p1 TRINITY_DN10655_c0_g1~~TRINITY_DN10655_c0_g1_i5.p1  ORF type:complete len:206 (+),score=38.96 TRINITY_DN10655_c0_g1_i5:207-824(+)
MSCRCRSFSDVDAIVLGERYEMEDMHLIGSVDKERDGDIAFVSFANDHVDNLGDRDHGDHSSVVVFSVSIPYDGAFPVSLRYTTRSDQGDHNSGDITGVDVLINGLEHGTWSFFVSKGLLLWEDKHNLINFRQGLNTIILKQQMGVSNNISLSIDYLDIDGSLPFASRGATLPYFEVEAENAATNGNTRPVSTANGGIRKDGNSN